MPIRKPADRLADVLRRELDVREIPHTTHSTSSRECLTVPLDGGDHLIVTAADMTTGGTLAEYRGLALFHATDAVVAEFFGPLHDADAARATDAIDDLAFVAHLVHSPEFFGSLCHPDDLDAELVAVLLGIQAHRNKITAEWMPAHRTAELLGDGWTVASYDPEVDGRVIRHPDGSAVRIFLHTEGGRRRATAAPVFPRHTPMIYNSELPSSVTVHADRLNSLAAEITRSILPAHRRTLVDILAHNEADTARQAERHELADRITAVLPQVTLRLTAPTLPVPDYDNMHGVLTGHSVLTGKSSLCNITLTGTDKVNLSIRFLPIDVALPLLAALGGILADRDAND